MGVRPERPISATSINGTVHGADPEPSRLGGSTALATADDGEDSLHRLEKQITLLVRRTMESVWQHGYGPNDAVDRYTYPVLLLLDEEGPHSLTALTAKLGVSKPTASRQVSRLSRAGLVDVSPHEADPRSVSVALTSAGAAARNEVRTARLAPLREVMDHWPDADRNALAALLDRFNTDLELFVR